MLNCFGNSPGHIYNSLKDPYMKTPSPKEEWLNISAGFEDTWNFPHCIGAIDGKHIRTECPNMTGTYCYNYKESYSIVLLAICDSNYCLFYSISGIMVATMTVEFLPNQKLEK